MKPIELRKVNTYPIAERRNLVHREDLIRPGDAVAAFESEDLDAVIEAIIAARRGSRPVIAMMGGHVIKSGLSPLIIDLMRRGVITHVAGNGAVSIHDFELALIGETSEDVPHALEDGSFGMAEETGAWMHRALKAGARDGLGYGAAIGRFIGEHPGDFPHRDVGVLYSAYTLGIPATIHITLGADIIHQHPDADFATLGATSGLDFRLFTASVSGLAGGVFLNFGSAVTGAEVFLKAVAISRNLGYPVAPITTANFDLVALGDYRSDVSKDEPVYYYRPRKNIINRPTSLGGRGYHINGDHRVTIPTIHQRVMTALTAERTVPDQTGEATLPDRVIGVLQSLVERHPALAEALPDLKRAYRALVLAYEEAGTLFLCGNGGSMADALHISGELLKSYAHPRPLPSWVSGNLAEQPDGKMLAANLESGLRAVVLGANQALSSAVENDMPDRNMRYAQELLALGRSGDLLLAISTSGNAPSVVYAVEVARALGLVTISLTGAEGGRLAEMADVALRAPEARTDRVQEDHVLLYHALCEMLELAFYGGPSDG